MAPAIFVALQCCQCSTMQVKQRKKSSNKWTCVVCNQKQSVLKVFAQGPMAKDVRKFVQSFNMSRKFTDQNQQPFNSTSEYDIDFEDDDDAVADGDDLENPKKRRTDWTEYLDSENHVEHKFVLQDEEQGRIYLEPEIEIVTELPAIPKEKFKRPKLRNYDNGEGSDRQQLYKPVLSKRNNRKETDHFSQGVGKIKESISNCKPATATTATGNSKWKPATATTATGNSKWKPATATTTTAKGNSKWKPATATTATGNSKWKDYITEDEEGQGHVFEWHCPRNSADHINKWGDTAVLDTESMKTQIVDDDIHPDFL